MIDVVVGINCDEIEFYTDLALNESQRWIEAVTRERFFDEDDFLYSLRHGTQLRKILNIVRPGCISLSPNSSDLPSCSREYFDDNLFSDQQSDDEEIEPWTVQFLSVCRTVLNFNDRQIFRTSDLDALIDENGRQGCLPVETLSKIRRVVVTVYELATLCESLSHYVGPKIDKTALEPLVNYHKRISDCEGLSVDKDLPSKVYHRGLQKDVKYVLYSILDRISFEEESSRSSAVTRELKQTEDNNRKAKADCNSKQLTCNGSLSESSNHSNEKISEKSACQSNNFKKSIESDVIAPILLPRDKTYQEKVSNYLRQNDFTIVRESNMVSTPDNDYQFHDYFPKSPLSPTRSDNVFYGSAAELSKDYRHQRDWSGASEDHELAIPTRNLVRTAGANKEPLKYVHATSHLHEAATEQMEKMKAQHLSREQLQQQDERAQDWKNDFDSWADKRRHKSSSALRRKSEREDVELRQVDNANKTGFFNKSAGGRSLNDVRYDYGRQEDEVEPNATPASNMNSSSSPDYRYQENNKIESDIFVNRQSFDQDQPRVATMKNYGSDMNKRRSRDESNYYDSEDYGKMSERYQSTPLHSANSSMDHSLSQQREPVIETIRETTKTYEKKTTFRPQISPQSSTSRYTVLSSTSQQENVNSKQTLTMDRGSIGSHRLIDVEGDSGVEMNHASPMSSPLLDSLSPNSQSSTDGPGKLDKLSPSHHHHHNHHLISNGTVYEKSGPLLEVVGNVPYGQTTKSNDKSYEDITINIKQRPSAERGFGFSLKGGKDRHEPITIATVLANSSADKSRLQINDEILEIDGENVTDKVLGSVNMTLREAVRIGQIELLLRRKLPKILDTSFGKPAVSPRFARKQSSFDETRERFEKPVETKVNKTVQPGRLPSTGVFHSRSSSGSASPAKFDTTLRTSSPKFNYQEKAKVTSPKDTSFSKNTKYTTSPSIRRRNPGRIEDFVPPVDREEENQTTEYKLTFTHGRQSPGDILNFVPESERPKTHKPVYTQGDDEPDSTDRHWSRERRIIEGSGDVNHQQHPSPDAEYHDAPPSQVHYDLPHMRPSVGDTYSRSSKSNSIDSEGSSNRLNSTVNDVIVPVYNPKSVAAIKVSKALNKKIAYEPKVAYETTIVDETDSLPSVSNPISHGYENRVIEENHAEFNNTSRPMEVSSLSYQSGNITEMNTHGSETMAFLAAKLRRMNSTRKLRRRSVLARLTYYGISSNVDDEQDSDDSFDLSPYMRRVEDSKMYDLATELLKMSGTDLYFDGPTSFTYKLDTGTNNQQETSKLIKSSPPQVSRRRSVVVVPIRNRDIRNKSETHERPTSFGKAALDTPKPFGHVKHEPVAFSFEPIPGAFSNGQKPTATIRSYNTAAPLYSNETALNEIERVFGPRDTPDRINGANSAELKYLELAAAEKAKRATLPRPMPHNDNINDHWMVREAENLRLSDQLKAERLTKQQMHADGNSIDVGYADSYQRQSPYRYLPDTTARPTYENDYGYDEGAYSSRAFAADTNGYNMQRPPSPKFPSNSIINQRYGTKLSTDDNDDDRIVAVSDRQICAHCNTELGRGAAMTIESLGLYYHLNCFKCYVCQIPLGDGVHGADVRVKDRRLNCQSCYVNDQSKIKI